VKHHEYVSALQRIYSRLGRIQVGIESSTIHKSRHVPGHSKLIGITHSIAYAGGVSLPKKEDLTPLVGAQTDISPLGRTGPKPAHEQTADEDVDVVDWNQMAAQPKFKTLLAKKRKFIIPSIIFFVAYYFALPILVGYAPELMRKEVWGPVNLAYLFALSQFFVAWAIAALYLKAASRFDRMADEVIAQGEMDVKNNKR
jgi:uncharacterized membrane protein (DUF485 family)